MIARRFLVAFLISSFGSSCWISTDNFAAADIVIQDNGGNVRYSNAFDSTGAFHGGVGADTLVSDQWYVWISSPVGTTEESGTIARTFALTSQSGGTGIASSTNSSITFNDIFIGVSTVGVTLNYGWDELNKEVTNSVDLDIDQLYFPTIVRLFNIYDYDDPFGGSESVNTASSSNIVFGDSVDGSPFASRQADTSPGSGFENALVNPLIPNNSGQFFAGALEPSGGFQWEFTFNQNDVLNLSGVASSRYSAIAVVPEPTSALVLGAWIGAFAATRRRR